MNTGAGKRPWLTVPPEGAFLIVDKPRGPSSHQVTAWVRNMLGVEKAGHSGTLDPGVSGLLVISVGKALRLLPLVLTFPKQYIALIQLHGTVDARKLEGVLKEFEGDVYQTPPVRSAVRRERRVRRIHSIRLVESEGTSLLLDVVCESGTYIRTLATDLGDALGVGAHMGELRRISNGPFGERDLVTLTRLADSIALAKEGNPKPLESLLHSPSEVWGELPKIVVKDTAVDALAHGADLAAAGLVRVTKPFAAGDYVVIVSRKSELVATGRALVDSTVAEKSKKGLVIDAERVFMAPGVYPGSWGPRKPARKGDELVNP